MILAVDTTREFGSLALVEHGQTVDELPLHAPEGFGQVLYAHLERLLEKHRLTVHAIDRFAAASGPGSFTGVRVGLACVKGLAEATGKPAVAVSNLEAVASFGTAPLRAAVLDARRGEIYGAVYTAAGALVAPEVVTSFPAWLTELPEGEIEFLSTDFTPFRPALASTRFAAAPISNVPRSLAAAIARLAENRPPQDPAALDANYVRRSDAELFWLG